MMPANVIIPTKSNIEDLHILLANLHADQAVNEIVVVADGNAAYSRLLHDAPVPITLLQVPLSIGLHTMWNLGMDHLKGRSEHLAIINDDVTLSDNAIGKICEILDRRPDIGLLTPTPDQSMTEEVLICSGFAGFCMVIANDLVDKWRFDENMKWWYGDNDIIMWINTIEKRVTGLSGVASATNNRSYTITNDPPPNFHSDIENDARIYHDKWNLNV